MSATWGMKKMKEFNEAQKVEYKKIEDTSPLVEKEIRVLNKKIENAKNILKRMKNTEGKDKTFLKIINNKKMKCKEGDKFYNKYLLKLKNTELKKRQGVRKIT